MDVEGARDLAHGEAFLKQPCDEILLVGPQLGRLTEGDFALLGGLTTLVSP